MEEIKTHKMHGMGMYLARVEPFRARQDFGVIEGLNEQKSVSMM